ncbi:MAG: selenium-dependent molybdenum cofactor biosynthesis protein YqeB [Anaerolineaceae bacterium]|nr:selenium-dependent molybdenum cofactor biosynthesis protein YqeB [Anaerolineaceae bacterium]
MSGLVIIRGGGDLASGVALRLFHSGYKIIIYELPEPLTVRRTVSFSETVFEGEWLVEDVISKLAKSVDEVREIINNDQICVIVDPDGSTMLDLQPEAIIDARMRKTPIIDGIRNSHFLIGIGPGFTAGKNCDAVIESNRGHFLGRVIWEGSAQADTGIPGSVHGIGKERVLYAPCRGNFTGEMIIGEIVKQGQKIGVVNETPIFAPFDGLLRGLIHSGLFVSKGLKIGDVDPRQDISLCKFVSEKALAIGGGVLEALLAKDYQKTLYDYEK